MFFIYFGNSWKLRYPIDAMLAKPNMQNQALVHPNGDRDFILAQCAYTHMSRQC